MDAAKPRGRPGDRPADADGRLAERARRGEAGAFGELYRLHVDAVFDYIYFRVRDEAVAEDLTQDVFMSAFKGIGDLRWGERFGGWLVRIAHNRVSNHWRSVSARPAGAPIEAADAAPPAGGRAGGDPQAALEAHLSAGDVLAATAGLTELQQQVIALRFVGGLSVAETAAAMGRSAGAVKNLQHHALAALRRHLDALGAGR